MEDRIPSKQETEANAMLIRNDLIQLNTKADSIPTRVINIKEFDVTLPTGS